MPSHSLSQSLSSSQHKPAAGLKPPPSVYKHKRELRKHHSELKDGKKLRAAVNRHRDTIGLLSHARRAWVPIMTTFSEFSRETSLHGWKFAMQAHGFFHKLIWIVLILAGIALAVYQIVTKVGTYIAEPLSVNIEISYNETLRFPTLTICSTLDAKVSWLMKKENQFLINRTGEMYRHAQPEKNEDENFLTRLNQSLGQFLGKSQLSAEELFLWCRTPMKRVCNFSSFRSVWTDAGLCHSIDMGESLRTAGPDYVLELIVDAASYEAIPTFPAAGLRMAVHPAGSMAVMSDAAFDVAAGTQTMVALNVQKTTRISRDDHRCMTGDDAKLEYFPGYSYVSCTLEATFVSAMEKCGCTPPLLLEYQCGGDEYLRSSRCDLADFFACLRPATGPSALTETQGSKEFQHHARLDNRYWYSKVQTHVLARALFGDNYTSTEDGGPVVATNCHPACVSLDYSKEFSYRIFRDDLLLRNLLHKEREGQMILLRNRYREAFDAKALYSLKNPDSESSPLKRASEAFADHVLAPAMTPLDENKQSDNVAKKLMNLAPCLNRSDILLHVDFTDTATNQMAMQIAKVDEMAKVAGEGRLLAARLGTPCTLAGPGPDSSALRTDEERRLEAMGQELDVLRDQAAKFKLEIELIPEPELWDGKLMVDAWRVDPKACFCNVTVFGSVDCYCSVDGLQTKIISTFREVQVLFESLAGTVQQTAVDSVFNNPIPVLIYAKIRGSSETLIQASASYFHEMKEEYATGYRILDYMIKELERLEVKMRNDLRIQKDNGASENVGALKVYELMPLTACESVLRGLVEWHQGSIDEYKADRRQLSSRLTAKFRGYRTDFQAKCVEVGGVRLTSPIETRGRVALKRELGKEVCRVAKRLSEEAVRINVTLSADRLIARWRRYAVEGAEKNKDFYDKKALDDATKELKEIDDSLHRYQREEITKSALNKIIKTNRKKFVDSVNKFEKAITDAIDFLNNEIQVLYNDPQDTET